MNFGKFISGLLVVTLAFLLQFWFPVGGIHGDFVLAALITFAFLFPVWEFLFFVLLAVFVMNWQPAFSTDIFAFALIPIAAFVVHRWLRWEPWIGAAVSTAAGVLLFYAIAAPGSFWVNISGLIADAIACVIFGEIALWGMGN
jgi:hypothetical protein